MMGIASMGANFGGIILPPSLGALIVATTWRWGFIALGGLSGVVGVLAILFVRDRRGGEGVGAGGRGPVLAFDRGATVREAFRNHAFYAMTFGIIAANFAYSAILSQIIPHLEAEGLSQERATLFLSIMAVFGMAGKVSFGYLTERFASRKVLGLSLFIQCICPGGADYAAGIAGAVPICAGAGVGFRGDGVGDAFAGAGHGGVEELRDSVWPGDAGYGILVVAGAAVDGGIIRPSGQLQRRFYSRNCDFWAGNFDATGGETHAPGQRSRQYILTG